MAVVALITDLFFVAKVKGTADGLGVPLVVVRQVEALRLELQAGARLVLIDLNVAGVDVCGAIRVCKERPQPPQVIGFLSHVQTELAEAARAAGADLVLPRSRFTEQLPTLLQAAP